MATKVNYIKTTGTLNCHGGFEHNINFYNCVGTFGFGNGFGEFPCFSTDISITNSKGTINISNCGKLTVSNGVYNIRGGDHVGSKTHEILIENSNLNFMQSSIDILGGTRNGNVSKIFQLKDCNISFTPNDTSSVFQFGFKNFDILKFNGCKFKAGSYVLIIQDNENFEISNSDIENLNIRLYNSSSIKQLQRISIKNNNLMFSDSFHVRLGVIQDSLINIANLSNVSNGVIEIENNTIRCFDSTVGRAFRLVELGYSPTNVTAMLVIRNNKLLAKTSGGMEVGLPTNTTAWGINTIVKGNLLDSNVTKNSAYDFTVQ